LCQASTLGTMHVGMCQSCCVAKNACSVVHGAADAGVRLCAAVCQIIALPANYVAKGSQQLSCTRQLLFYSAHVGAATVLHCVGNLRVLQTCSMCLVKAVWQWWHRQQQQHFSRG
jgi:hypothetical protein